MSADNDKTRYLVLHEYNATSSIVANWVSTGGWKSFATREKARAYMAKTAARDETLAGLLPPARNERHRFRIRRITIDLEIVVPFNEAWKGEQA